MRGVVSIERCFTRFTDTYSPKVVGELNGQHVKVVRVEGDKCPWHTHDQEDELFFVVEGVLEIQERGDPCPEGTRALTLRSGEFYIVPRGREHRVLPHGHVKLILFEPARIEHTGKVRAEITKDHYEWLDLGDG
jgi:mannose-6-phosphate isomerase-like protein (cupin superfamily)